MEGEERAHKTRQKEAKREYEKKVNRIVAYTEGMTNQVPDPELAKLREEADQAHQVWVDTRRNQVVREKAIEGKNQKRRRVLFWKEKVSTHMERLIQERQEDDWYTDQYWGLIPVKVRQAERRCQEYEEMLAEFLPELGTATGKHRIHLQTCTLCGEIILGRGNKEKPMATHKHYAHWTEM